MTTVERTPQAEEDLIEVWQYIARDDDKAATAHLRRLDETCVRLAEQPGMGRARPEIRSDLRSFPVGKYVILYRVVDDGVLIVRVVHGARDLSNLFD